MSQKPLMDYDKVDDLVAACIKLLKTNGVYVVPSKGGLNNVMRGEIELFNFHTDDLVGGRGTIKQYYITVKNRLYEIETKDVELKYICQGQEVDQHQLEELDRLVKQGADAYNESKKLQTINQAFKDTNSLTIKRM